MGAGDEIAKSWLDLHDRLFDAPIDAALGRFRTGFVFRGLNNVAHERMTTSLMRLGGDPATKERHLLRNFRKYAYLDVRASDSDWYWLAVGQHYGLPTRLLDWTYSPYVALHFATSDLRQMDQDGLIWCVDVDETKSFLPGELAGLLDAEGAYVFTTEMLQRVAARLEDLEDLPGEFVVFLEPPSLDARIVNQYALFSLMSSPDAMLDDWLRKHSATFRRIIVPAAVKWEVRDKLDQANITERVLFPGLDGLSRWLRRYYLPRRDAERARAAEAATDEQKPTKESGQQG
jgi:hypothetical protein